METILSFLTDLSKNNNRDWFNGNKKTYQEAHAEFANTVEDIILQIGKFDNSVNGLTVKDCMLRIYRDVRFSKDKTPYHTYFGAHIIEGGRKSEHAKAGYYLRIEPDKSFLAGGAYLPPSDWINAIRQEIDYNPQAFINIIQSRDFTTYFGSIQGEQLKTAPKGYPKDHPHIDLLRHKSFLAVHEMNNADLLGNDFIAHCAKVFKALQPFSTFLNKSKD